MGRGLLLAVMRARGASELSEVMTVSLLLVLGPVRRPDVVRRSQDVQEGGGTSNALDSETEPVSPGLLVSPGQTYL